MPEPLHREYYAHGNHLPEMKFRRAAKSGALLSPRSAYGPGSWARRTPTNRTLSAMPTFTENLTYATAVKDTAGRLLEGLEMAQLSHCCDLCLKQVFGHCGYLVSRVTSRLRPLASTAESRSQSSRQCANWLTPAFVRRA
jgi:hypothetical protein